MMFNLVTVLLFTFLASCISEKPFESFKSSEISDINFNGDLDKYLQPDNADSGAYDEAFMDGDNQLSASPKSLERYTCTRECDDNSMICYYKFRIQHYSTMGIACGNCSCSTNARCTTNTTHCYNNHCITADGIARNIIVVNKKYPGPSIQVCKGDRVIIDVTNALLGKTASLHWHGIFQKGTPWMDGVSMLSQCPILPGTTFRYNFIASEPGTHFWHDHAGLIKLDGVQGPLIVREPRDEAPNSAYYDYDLPSHIIFLTDWKHFMSDDEFPDMKNLNGRRIQSLLINGKGLFSGVPYYYNPTLRSPLATFNVTRGHSYRFRIVGALCMMCAVELLIDRHVISVIAVDGNPIKPLSVSSLVITSGERYDIIVDALADVGSYWIYTRGIYPCQATTQMAILNYHGSTYRNNYFNPPQLLRTLNHPNFTMATPTNFLVSELRSSRPTPSTIRNPASTAKFSFVVKAHEYSLQDFTDGDVPLYYKPFSTGIRSTINGLTSSMPSVPLYTQFNETRPDELCSADCVNGNSTTPCEPCVHLVKIPLNTVIDFIITDPANYTGIVHPFHLHGHKFYVLEQGMMGGEVTLPFLLEKLEAGIIKPIRPPIKDTIIVPIGAYAIIRFNADNPGIWIFHCHFAYHNAVGMHVYLQVGEPRDFPRAPLNFPKCGSYLPAVRN